MTAYWQLLRDPRWQRMRLEVMRRDDFKCRKCRAVEKTLNVHHTFYVKGRAPWEYETESLLTLCEDCHQSTHVVAGELSKIAGQLPPEALDELLGYARGIAAVTVDRFSTDDVAIQTDNAEQARGVLAAIGVHGRVASAPLIEEGVLVGYLSMIAVIDAHVGEVLTSRLLVEDSNG